MGKSFVRPAISGMCALGGGLFRRASSATKLLAGYILTSQRGYGQTTDSKGSRFFHGNPGSLHYPLDIQILREKVFMVCFWGPNTFSGVDWMSRDQFNALLRGNLFWQAPCFLGLLQTLTLPENNKLAMKIVNDSQIHKKIQWKWHLHICL